MDGITALVEALGLGVMILGTVVLYIAYIIGYWKIFTKAGEAGWKSIIPFYNVYTLYKISWKTPMFFIFLIAVLVSGGISGLGTNATGLISVIGLILYAVVIVIQVIQCNKLAKAFGKGIGFTLGLVFLNTIFIIILGLGSSEYKGNPCINEF